MTSTPDTHAKRQVSPDAIEPSPDAIEETGNIEWSGRDLFPMVGLGGSAGAVPALQTFFAAMPPNPGMVFVVVLHLSAEHESVLPEILQRVTAMPVRQVMTSVKVEIDHVYVIPPGKAISSVDGFLTVVDLTPDRGRRVAVDLFFRTLADTHGPKAMALVLSGADGDGAIGIKRIKERGGLTVVQDPEEADHSGMPRAAVATGMVDWVLRIADVPARLIQYADVRARLELPAEGDQAESMPIDSPADDDRELALLEVLQFLRARTGRDFSYYKRATIVRRVARRMSVNGQVDLPGYLSFMRTHPGEAGALLGDMLVNVTNFFRDRSAFEALRGVIPDLFEGKKPRDELRVWVPACATGEEAFSIAILLCEHAATLDAPPMLQVFATDLDEESIRIAREAVYPTAIVADVSEERLRRFFVREARGYRLRSEIREKVLFAVHDLVKDAPFSRLDLVSCRNLLIYLSRQAQERVLEIAHFALRDKGRLFLGTSETADAAPLLFEAVDLRHRVYGSRAIGRSRLPIPVSESAVARALEMQEHSRIVRDMPRPPVPRRAPGFPGVQSEPAASGASSWRELHFRLIERLAAPSIVVTQDHDIVHLSDRAGRFLRHAAGEPSNDLVATIDPKLALDLRSALVHMRDGRERIETRSIPYDTDAGEKGEVVLRVSRADDVAADFLLVEFDVRAGSRGDESAEPQDDRLVRQVEELRWHLRDVTSEGEIATQELKASNEELQAINEELRSASEELETSREELQSINEELTTVNHELKGKVDELARTNGDLQNLMAATEIATVFLDRELRVTLFTPTATRYFTLIPSDVGRPLAHLSTKLDYPELYDDARRVLDSLVPAEREVRCGDQRVLARLLPYRSGEDRISGVVVTLVDITALRSAEAGLRRSEAEFRAVVDQAAAGVITSDARGIVRMANDRFAAMRGPEAGDPVGESLFELVYRSDGERYRNAYERLLREGRPFQIELRLARRDAPGTWVSVAHALTSNEAAETTVIGVIFDIAHVKRAEQALLEHEERLRLIVDNAAEYAIFSMDLERRITAWNVGAQLLTGYSAEEMHGRPADILFVEEDRRAGAVELEASTALSQGRAADERWHRRKDGSRFWGSGAMMAMLDHGRPIGLLKIFRDQTTLRLAQEAIDTSRTELLQAMAESRRAHSQAEAASQAKDRFLAVLSHELRTPLTPVVLALHALARDDTLPDSARRTLDIIRRNVSTELVLIDDLLDVTRISSGKFEMGREPVDLHAVVKAALAVCEADFAAKRQRVTALLEAADHRFSGDPARLEQVIWNLLKNASKFSPVEGDIRVESSSADGWFEVRVRDRGVGIEPEALGTIFEAFAQEGPWVTSQFGGLGLGLAIAKATVEGHGGVLSVESKGRGHGSCFTVRLPLRPPVIDSGH